MKKTTAVLLALTFLVCICFAGCSKDKSDTKTTTKTQKTFTVGFDAEFPPYGYVDDDGNYVGFDLDLAKEVCKRNGWKIVLQPIDWDSKDMELNSGTIDCIWNGFTITGREDDYTWSDPYFDNSQVIVVRAGSGIKSFSDLAGKIVAVQTDSSALAALQDEEDADMVALTKSFKELAVVKDYLTAFENLEAGAVDAIAIDIGVAQHQIEKRGSDKFVILDTILSKEQYAVGFKKGNTELRDQVQKTIDEMMADGTFQKIAENWNLSDGIIVKD